MGKKPVQPKYRPRPRERRARLNIAPRGRTWTPGACRWCRCTDLEACPNCCGWANGAHTLCTACVDVEREWTHLTAAQLPAMRRAFFLGFMAGSDDERARGNGNEYRTGGTTAKYWDLGHVAGARQAR